MSIKERLERILAERQLKEEELRKAREQAKAEQDRRILEEFDKAIEARPALIKKFLGTGIHRIIEEFVDRPLWELREERGTQVADKLPPRPHKKPSRRDIERTRHNSIRWEANVFGPSLSGDGHIDHGLVIEIRRKQLQRPGRNLENDIYMPRVLLRFDPGGLLKIEGRQVQYKGKVLEGNSSREVIEEALAEALADPYIPERPPTLLRIRRL